MDTAKLKQARAQVQQSQASLKQLEEQLGYTTIVAPMDGVILSRDVEIGDAVSSILVLGSTATLVMTEGDTTEVYVQGKVDEADIAHVYLGQPARIKVESFRDRIFYGKVTKIAPMGVEKDNVTTFEVRVSINNPGGELKANMTANAEILLDEHKGVLTVPENAVHLRQPEERLRADSRQEPERGLRARFRSRSASPTEQLPRSSAASKKATRSCCSSKNRDQRSGPATAFRDVMKTDQVNVVAFTVFGDFQEIENTQKARLAGHLGRDVGQADGRDGLNLDGSVAHGVAIAHLDVRTGPDADAGGDLAAHHARAQFFGEHHDSF